MVVDTYKTTRNPIKVTKRGAPKSSLRLQMEGMKIADVLHVRLPFGHPAQAIRISQRVNSLCTVLSGYSPKLIRYRWQVDDAKNEIAVRREA